MTVPVIEYMEQPVPEGGSCVITAYLEQTDGTYVPLASLTTLKLWLDDSSAGTTINSKADTDIKNANGGVVAEVSEGGVTRTKLTLTLGAADNPMVDTAKRSEWHVATIRGTSSGGTVIPKAAYFKVINMPRTP